MYVEYGCTFDLRSFPFDNQVKVSGKYPFETKLIQYYFELFRNVPWILVWTLLKPSTSCWLQSTYSIRYERLQPRKNFWNNLFQKCSCLCKGNFTLSKEITNKRDSRQQFFLWMILIDIFTLYRNPDIKKKLSPQMLKNYFLLTFLNRIPIWSGPKLNCPSNYFIPKLYLRNQNQIFAIF